MIEVSIELGLREKEASKLFREFLKLKRQDRLHQIYPEIEPSLPSFLKLHKVLKKRGLNPGNVEWFADAIEMGTIKLPELQGQYQSLQNRVWRMEHRKQELERDCQVIQRRIMELTETHNMLQQNFDTLTEKVSTSTIMAVIQALRENPNRHDIIFDNSEIRNGLGSGCGNTTSSFPSPSYPST